MPILLYGNETAVEEIWFKWLWKNLHTVNLVIRLITLVTSSVLHDKSMYQTSK